MTFQGSKQAARVTASEPQNLAMEKRPDCILPILNAWGLLGEIQIWRGEFSNLPTEDSHLLQDFASQTARAFERAYSLEMEKTGNSAANIRP